MKRKLRRMAAGASEGVPWLEVVSQLVREYESEIGILRERIRSLEQELSRKEMDKNALRESLDELLTLHQLSESISSAISSISFSFIPMCVASATPILPIQSMKILFSSSFLKNL